MAEYKTPGVYVEEISTLPASIASVSTAIPAFIGYTQKAEKNGKDLINKPVRISSMLDFVEMFGMAPEPVSLSVDLNKNNGVNSVSISSSFNMYNSLRLFYSNGGGDCWIVAVGKYTDGSVNADKLKTGLAEIKLEDEPTMLLFPDAVNLGADDLASVQQTALSQCDELQDRVAILDIKNGDTKRNYDKDTDIINVFRNKIGVNDLKYGAAYYPFLRTSLSFDFGYKNVKGNLTKNGNVVTLAAISADSSYVDQLDLLMADQTTAAALTDTPHTTFPAPFNAAPYDALSIAEGYDEITKTNNKDEMKRRARYIKNMLTGFVAMNASLTDADASNTIDDKTTKELHDDAIAAGTGPNYSTIETYMRTLVGYDQGYTTTGGTSALAEAAGGDFAGYDFTGVTPVTDIYGTPAVAAAAAVANARPHFQALYEGVLSLIMDFVARMNKRGENVEATLEATNPIYSNIVKAVKQEGIVLPPSGAMAGVYASVDNDRGVWKAPANVSLSSVVEPMVKIDDRTQEDLNVDTNAGKSVNAIRFFNGKGILVWGARTLAGNDNEWRYVSVRRFYNMVEESVKKATGFVVFEPNDANTWVRTKAMIENYLTGLWKAGALAGAKPEHAFFVKVGLGETMTAQDILEGRMIIEIGMAAVRPAEFIILRFSHKLQES